MIITRTPFRISFFGGGTDYPVYYREYGGVVLSTTINKYCYITTRYLPPFFDYKYRIRYTKREEVSNIDDISHPVVRESLRHYGVKRGIEMVHTSDIPAMSGIASSSAFTVGFIHSLHALQGNMVTKRQLARESIHMEQDILKEAVGSQDQVAVAFGGFNKIEFGGNKNFYVTPITISNERIRHIESRLMLFFTGFARNASEIAKEQILLTHSKVSELNAMKQIAEEVVEILKNKNSHIDKFGRMLHETWMIKRKLSKLITNNKIDNIYEAGMKAGALGGKLIGAGGGGFIIFYVPPEKQKSVKIALAKLVHVPFSFEDLGSQIIMYSRKNLTNE